MKKIWDSQNNEVIYGLNEAALHSRIQSKKQKAYHITNASEYLAMFSNFAAGVFVLSVSMSTRGAGIFMYILAAWMFLSGGYVLFARLMRMRDTAHFDRTMHGDLSHAIALANYQVRFSQLMRWNILPMALIILLSVWQNGKSWWMAAGLIVFFALAAYASGWEHSIYKSRKRELEMLKQKLESD